MALKKTPAEAAAAKAEKEAAKAAKQEAAWRKAKALRKTSPRLWQSLRIRYQSILVLNRCLSQAAEARREEQKQLKGEAKAAKALAKPAASPKEKAKAKTVVASSSGKRAFSDEIAPQPKRQRTAEDAEPENEPQGAELDKLKCLASSAVSSDRAGFIAAETGLQRKDVAAAVRFLDAGVTLPSRYRKDAVRFFSSCDGKEETGSMDETALRRVERCLRRVEALESRRKTIAVAMLRLGKLDEVVTPLLASTTIEELEDLYEPYKAKRRQDLQVRREAIDGGAAACTITNPCILTAGVSIESAEKVQVCLTSMTGVLVAQWSFDVEATISSLADEIQKACNGMDAVIYATDGNEVLGAELLKEYAVLTVKLGQLLKPSLTGTEQMMQAPSLDALAGLRPVEEIQACATAVTCVCFGQESLHKDFVLLAVCSKSGEVVVFKCYRTRMERQMLSDLGSFEDDSETPVAAPDGSSNSVHSRCVGHSRAITSICFNFLENELLTSSIDKSVRAWSVDSGAILRVYTDSSPVCVVRWLPLSPQAMVVANKRAILRIVRENGMALQKLKVDSEVHALEFDGSGSLLFAGTKSGHVHVLDILNSNQLQFKFKVVVSPRGVTCMRFASAKLPQLLVSTADNSATIFNCTYAESSGEMMHLAVQRCVGVAHSLFPLKCCYSPSGSGYFISASEDTCVYIFSLSKAYKRRLHLLKHHKAPVVAVAVNSMDTLLASADSLGNVVLWRRLDGIYKVKLPKSKASKDLV